MAQFLTRRPHSERPHEDVRQRGYVDEQQTGKHPHPAHVFVPEHHFERLEKRAFERHPGENGYRCHSTGDHGLLQRRHRYSLSPKDSSVRRYVITRPIGLCTIRMLGILSTKTNRTVAVYVRVPSFIRLASSVCTEEPISASYGACSNCRSTTCWSSTS